MQHPGLILIPYTVSFMSVFEYYRMKIPLFVPTPALLEEWDHAHHLLGERTWHRTRGVAVFRSPFPRHPQSTSKSLLDPNDEQNRQSAKEWIGFSDW